MATKPTGRPGGRPPVDNPRNQVVAFRVTADELDAITQAAQAGDETTSEYARRRALGQRLARLATRRGKA